MPQENNPDRQKVVAARRKGPFRYNAIREVVLKAADDLTKAIAKQNPGIDPDAFEDDLRALVKRHGGGMPAEASVSDNSSKPSYIFAGDMLCLAHEAFQQKNYKEAFKLFSSAMETDDVQDLIAGIAAMNEESGFGSEEMSDDADPAPDMAEDEESDEMDDAMEEAVAEFEEDEEYSEDDEEMEGDEPDMEEDSEEYDESDEEEEYDDESEMEDEESEMEDESEEDAGDAFGPDAVMAAPLKGKKTARNSKVVSAVDQRLRAILNKASIDGSEESRRAATKLLARHSDSNKKHRK